jgi:hypothetical protein
MEAIERQKLIAALLIAYELGVDCCKEVNSNRKWTDTKSAKERAALNRLMKSLGASKLTEEEYAQFCK